MIFALGHALLVFFACAGSLLAAGAVLVVLLAVVRYGQPWRGP